MAGDVYSHAPYAGRGGWSWYTGSAAWLQRAALESMFGLTRNSDGFSLKPCLPGHWLESRLSVAHAGRRVHVALLRPAVDARDEAQVRTLLEQYRARPLPAGQHVRWADCQADERFLLLLE